MRRILCLPCDGVKTPRDLALIGKAPRQEAKDYRVKPAIHRPLPCGKRSLFKKKIDGTIVLRHPGAPAHG